MICLVNSDNGRDSLYGTHVPGIVPSSRRTRIDATHNLMHKAMQVSQSEREPKQVCDALGCSGSHACYIDRHARPCEGVCDTSSTQAPSASSRVKRNSLFIILES